MAHLAQATEADLRAANGDAARAAMVARYTGFVAQPAADEASRAGMVPSDLVSMANEDAGNRKRKATKRLPPPREQAHASSSLEPALRPTVAGVQTIPHADSNTDTSAAPSGHPFH